jgi:hypothetical protein
MVLSDSSLAQRKEDKLDRFSVEASKWMIQMGGSISYGRVYIISRGFSVTNPNRGQSDRYTHACSPGRHPAQKRGRHSCTNKHNASYQCNVALQSIYCARSKGHACSSQLRNTWEWLYIRSVVSGRHFWSEPVGPWGGALGTVR